MTGASAPEASAQSLINGALKPQGIPQEGLRFTHLQLERGKKIRRITLALTRTRDDGRIDYYVRADESSAAGSLGRRSDRHFTDERTAHEHYERVLHRHLARGYRETRTGQGFETWWLFSWGFQPEQIDPDATHFAGALTSFIDKSIAPRARHSGWRAYGAAVDAPLRRAFLVIGEGEPRLLDPSLVESAQLPQRAFLLDRIARRLGLSPLVLEVGVDHDGQIHPFDLHSVRGESIARLPRSERQLLLRQILLETASAANDFDPVHPICQLPWSDSLRGGYWAVSPDETQTYWVS